MVKVDQLFALFPKADFWKFLRWDFLIVNISLLSILFLASLVILGNFKERSLTYSFLEEKFYTHKEVEDFVASISPYTPVLEEEPSLTAEIVAFDEFQASDQEFLEKPELATTLPSALEPAKKQESRNQIVNYTVSSGDTLSKIASGYDLSLKTLAEVNNLSSVHQIKPGQNLLIPPADGIIHTVSKGETLAYLVKKYQGDLGATLKYNSENLQVGQKVVIVGGKVSPPQQKTPTKLASSRNVLVRENQGSRTLGTGGNKYNGYPWGWCTWYAAYRRNVPGNWGNAGRWLSSAARSGYKTGSAPQAGAIIVTKERWPLGHVGYVEDVSGDSVIISEMNYKGWGIVSSRTISRSSSVILGYIY